MASPNNEVAQAFVGVCMTIFALFAGFLITKNNIPDYWIWIFYISFMHYPLEAILINEMKGQTYDCPNNKGAVPIPIVGENAVKLFCPITSGDEFLQSFDIDTNNKYPDMAVTLGMIGGMLCLCFIALRYIRHLNR